MARQNKYEIYLLNNPNLSFQCCTTINPATFLEHVPEEKEFSGHDCLQLIHEDTSPRPDLRDTAMSNPDVSFFTDGSSSIDEQGRRLSGYAIVNQDGDTVESAAFENPFSAQQAELFALTRACTLAEGISANIYTDSQYAFGVVHDYGQLWKNRGFLTSSGTVISHQKLVSNLLQAIQLPSQLAVIKVRAHTSGQSPIDIGNRLADEAAKKASWTNHIVVPRMMRQTKNSSKNQSPPEKGMPTIQEVLQIQEDAPVQVKQLWQDQGCVHDPVTSLWVTPAGQTCMSDELALWVIECVHFATHCGAKAISDMLLETWWHPKLLDLSQRISQRCLICQQHNPGKGLPCEPDTDHSFWYGTINACRNHIRSTFTDAME
ncbi:uncharacterized protein LOC116974905 [Amblyraja radiata]|uniref:uncharacterized protein LOC116974905 n=1 Tax=Amblyraja radiata TaxID=386614 RepID=UPI0014034F41|nr:uncharacterized protein LOC116974905 [Amblyraja radiata]